MYKDDKTIHRTQQYIWKRIILVQMLHLRMGTKRDKKPEGLVDPQPTWIETCLLWGKHCAHVSRKRLDDNPPYNFLNHSCNSLIILTEQERWLQPVLSIVSFAGDIIILIYILSLLQLFWYVLHMIFPGQFSIYRNAEKFNKSFA